MGEERCVCCGDIIPEGTQVCQKCSKKPVQAELEGGGAQMVVCLRRMPWEDRQKGFILPALRQADHVGMKLRFIGG